MDPLSSLTIDAFLDRIADRAPTPGGGSVAACAGALGCALAQMVAAYSIGKNATPESTEYFNTVQRRLRRVDEMMRVMITQDANSYAELDGARKELKSNDSPSARERLRQAQQVAIAIPLEIAALSSRALAIMNEMKETTNEHLLSDLGIAANLTKSAADGAALLVRVNIPSIEVADEKTRLNRECQTIAEHCRQLSDQIAAFVASKLKS